jgi:hypothetical protein
MQSCILIHHISQTIEKKISTKRLKISIQEIEDLGMLSDKGNENPSKKHKLGWGFIITATALGLTAIGTSELLNGISNLLIIMALPFSFLYVYIVFLFFKNIIIKKSTYPPI